jgi:hypothetical protein
MSTNSGWCLWSIPLHKRFAIGHRLQVWPQFPTFFPPLECLSRVIALKVLATQLTAVFMLDPGLLASFLKLRLYFSRLSRPGRSLFTFQSLNLFVDWLYAESIETVKSRAALSASFPELTSDSESELLFDWRFTANQFVLAPIPLRITTRVFF